MAAGGESLGIVNADGELSLSEIVSRALRLVRDKDYAKVSGVLEIDGDACGLHILQSRGSVEALCLDCESAGVRKGASALEALRSKAGYRPVKGYLEALALTREGYEIDLELEPDARLPRPVEADRLLAVGEARGAEAPRAEPGAEEQEAAEAQEEGKAPEIPLTQEELDNPVLISAERLANLLVFLIWRSSMAARYRDPARLLLEARERSKNDREVFYRAIIEISGDGMFNAFYYDGRLCSVIYMDPKEGKAIFLRGLDEQALIERIREAAQGRGLELSHLYRVDCWECARVFLEDCIRRIEEKGEEEREKEERKGGLLARLLRRRRR